MSTETSRLLNELEDRKIAIIEDIRSLEWLVSRLSILRKCTPDQSFIDSELVQIRNHERELLEQLHDVNSKIKDLSVQTQNFP